MDGSPVSLVIDDTSKAATCRPPRQRTDQRKMVVTTLYGRHTYQTSTGVDVHIWLRDGKYVARGSFNGSRFGNVLGVTEHEADTQLRRVLVEIEEGRFVRSSESRGSQVQTGVAPRLNLLELADRFLTDTRKLRGKKTASDYRARLAPALEFWSTPEIRKGYPFAFNLDRAFVINVRAFLFQRLVTRNGHAVGKPRPLSAGQVFNILSTMAILLNWAKKPGVHLLPLHFANPFTHDIIGERSRRDPLAPPTLPMDLRIALVGVMDAWQLCTLAWPFILPERPEEFAGLVLDEVDTVQRQLIFATRLGGSDFNKSRHSSRAGYPSELDLLVNCLGAHRGNRPTFLISRAVWDKFQTKGTKEVAEGYDAQSHLQRALAKAVTGEVQAEQDRKRLFRCALLKHGGVHPNDLAAEFQALLAKVRPGMSARFYDLRGSVSTDMKRAGVDEVYRRHVTGRSLAREMLARYESQDPQADLKRYFEFMRPLLTAITQRAAELGIAGASPLNEETI